MDRWDSFMSTEWLTYHRPRQPPRFNRLINLAAKCAGTRSAGNPPATRDVAGTGNGTTDSPPWYRASSRPSQDRPALRDLNTMACEIDRPLRSRQTQFPYIEASYHR